MDTAGVVKGLKGALAALDAHEPVSLLGLRETQWLDVKGCPYQLADPKAVEELAKGVAAFANGGGGVIVIGIATRLEHHEEVLDRIVGVDPATVNVDQIRKRIRPRGCLFGRGGLAGFLRRAWIWWGNCLASPRYPLSTLALTAG